MKSTEHMLHLPMKPEDSTLRDSGLASEGVDSISKWCPHMAGETIAHQKAGPELERICTANAG